MKKKLHALARTVPLLLLCTLLLISVAHADFGPKPALTLQVVNAPEGTLYLDLLTQGEADPDPYFTKEDEAKYDPVILAQLRTLEGNGWFMAYSTGVAHRAPVFGDLLPGSDGVWNFSYVGLPETFRIAAATADHAQAVETPYTREFISNLVYDWETNTVQEATPGALRFLARLLTTLLPTLLVEGAVYWWFGFREKRTWLVFLAMNAATQIGLHIACGSMVAVTGWHPLNYFLTFLIPELIIFVVESVVFAVFAREKSTGNRIGCAHLANLASFVAGYFPLYWLMDFLLRL